MTDFPLPLMSTKNTPPPRPLSWLISFVLAVSLGASLRASGNPWFDDFVTYENAKGGA
jgi:hypothetical protein